jgi:hypothetical protein
MDWIWMFTGGHYWLLIVYMILIMAAAAYLCLWGIVQVFGTDEYDEY